MFGSGDGASPEAHETPGKIRLLLLYGGKSAEHEVSCISAFHVLKAARPDRYDVQLVGITTEGRWMDAVALEAGLDESAASLPSPDLLAAGVLGTPQRGLADQAAGEPGSTSTAEAGQGEDSLPVPSDQLDPLRTVAGDADDRITVVFPLLHGPNGEDGTVQGMLDLAQVPYVGAGVAGSATCMDKGLTKAALAAAGLPQVRHILLRDDEIDETTPKRVEAELSWPVFVKPANLGSSVGVSRAVDAEEFARSLELALSYDEWVIIEEAVNAREIEVGVLGMGTEMRASVPGEVVPSHEFYDFEDKYLDGTSRSVIPADIPGEVAAEARRLAVLACRETRVDGMARVDFFYEAQGRGLVINEINTIPGFTPISQYPQLWAATGVDYPTLIDELVKVAIARHQRRSHFDAKRRNLPGG